MVKSQSTVNLKTNKIEDSQPLKLVESTSSLTAAQSNFNVIKANNKAKTVKLIFIFIIISAAIIALAFLIRTCILKYRQRQKLKTDVRVAIQSQSLEESSEKDQIQKQTEGKQPFQILNMKIVNRIKEVQENESGNDYSDQKQYSALRDITIEQLNDLNTINLPYPVKYLDDVSQSEMRDTYKQNSKESGSDSHLKPLQKIENELKPVRSLTPVKRLFYDAEYRIDTDPDYQHKLSLRRQTIDQNRDMVTRMSENNDSLYGEHFNLQGSQDLRSQSSFKKNNNFIMKNSLKPTRLPTHQNSQRQMQPHFQHTSKQSNLEENNDNLKTINFYDFQEQASGESADIDNFHEQLSKLRNRRLKAIKSNADSKDKSSTEPKSYNSDFVQRKIDPFLLKKSIFRSNYDSAGTTNYASGWDIPAPK